MSSHSTNHSLTVTSRHPFYPHLSRLVLFKVLLVSLLTFPSLSPATDSSYFIDGRTDWGSKAAYHPVRMLVNGAFDIMQTDVERRSPMDVPFGAAWRNLSWNITHPLEAVSRHGRREFMASEILPLGMNLENAQYVPNYNLHLIGGGLVYRHLFEWYRLQGAPAPAALAVLNCLGYHLVNEMVENGAFSGVNVDPIADLYIFNPLGWLLFSFDTPTRFFARTLNAADWSGMPMVDPIGGWIDNASLNWSFKWFPFQERIGLFAYAGMTGIAGLSWRRPNGLALSGGMGMASREIVDVDRNGSGEGRKSSAHMVWSTGLFLDRDNSLLASILVSGQRLYRLRVNVYPLGGKSLWGRMGYFAGLGQDGRASGGAMIPISPLGLSFGSRIH